MAGDYIAFDFSDNYVLEEIEPDTYFMIAGGTQGATVSPGLSRIASTFGGLYDYCVTKTEMEPFYRCDSQATAHASCVSPNNRWTLTRR